MDVPKALALVAQESARSSQSLVAKRIGVPRDAVTRWKSGGTPTGKSREKLLAWAQTVGDRPAPAPRPVAAARAVLDPVAQLVAEGQAEQAAWVLEFAARLLEAGARRLRQGAQREDILSAVERTEVAITQPKKARRRASEA
jgi:transcriptional regulator with XRE-family HTH domain